MSKTLSQDVNKHHNLLSLPLEIREKIYSHLLLRAAIIVQDLRFEVNSWIRLSWDDPPIRSFENTTEIRAVPESLQPGFPKRNCGIFSVSRQISEEALNILYGRNLFVVSINNGVHIRLLKFGIANIRRIRHLTLAAQSMGLCYPSPIRFDSQLWLPLLADLNRLYLVVQQPVEKRQSCGGHNLAQDVKEWVTWLEPIFHYLAQNLDRNTGVRVDDNNMMETRNLVQKYFNSGYKRIQNGIGDMLFKLGMFSLEAQYGDGYGGRSNCKDWGVSDTDLD